MTPSGAYEDEMGRFLRLSDEELSRFLAGEAGVRDEAFDEVASMLGGVRETYAAASLGDKTRALHLAAISDTARLAADKGNLVARPASKIHGPVELQVSELRKWRRVMDKSIGLAVKAVAATIATSMSIVGLAYAGVDLPGQAAERAFEAITGLELPNQGSDEEKSVADEVRSVVESDLKGCERGQAVPDAADANRQDEAMTETDPCDADGDRATGEEKSAAGRAKAAEKSGGRSESRGSEAATAGRATATERSGGASDAGADNGGTNHDAGRAKAAEASSSGSSNADTAAEKGTTTADEASSSGKETGSSSSEGAQAKNPTGKGAP